MKHFKHYLLGQKFIVRTDHAPLIWLRNFKEPKGLIARWISVIETSDYTIQYRPGRQHLNADSLSRKPNRKCPNPACFECYPYNSSLSMDNDEGADNNGSVTMTDLLQESMCSSQPPVTPSSPAPGQDDGTGIPWVQMVTASHLSAQFFLEQMTPGITYQTGFQLGALLN